MTEYIFCIYNRYINTAAILIKTDPILKASAQKTARSLGLSLTSVINRYLKSFIKTKTVTFSNDDEIPNARTIRALKESEADYKAGRKISFASGKDVLAYLDKEIANERSRHASR